MTAPVSAAAAPYATMLDATHDIPDVRWRWQAIHQLAKQGSTLPTDPPVGGDDASTVETTRPRAIGNGSVAAAAGGIDSPPATGCTCRPAPPGYDDIYDARCPVHGCHQIADWLDQ